MKRILIFSLAYFPHVGGAEIALKEITDRIDPHDVSFHMITVRFDGKLPKKEKIGNIDVHRVGIPGKSFVFINKLLYQFTACFKALSLHRKYRYGAIWAMMAHSSGVPAGLFKTLKPQVKYLLTLQEGDPPEYIERRTRLLRPFFKRGFTKADMVQSISTFLGQWARRMNFSGPLEVIPNAVNTKHFSQRYSSEEITSVQKEIGKKKGDIFLVTTSRLVHKNAVDDVIKALPFLPKNVKFLIFGTGPDETMLRRVAKEKEVIARVIFYGQIEHAVMPKYLKACDIFIRPSRSEGMGNSFIEAFAAELPVIATQEGGIADFLFDEKRNPDKQTTGWAVDKDAPEQIAAAVKDIVARPEKVAEVVKTAKGLAERRYDWDIVARDMKTKVFDKLLKEG